MNKILPIILVVVLSGCSGNTKMPLENCADADTSFFYQIENEALSLQPEKMQMIIKYFYKHSLTGKNNKEARANYNKSVGAHYYYKKHLPKYLDDYEKIENKFTIMSLQEKLKYNHYFTNYMICEKKRDAYPQTFDAKWK